ncbi:MAG: hypothetical protein H6817_10895 [Phycisphaerales bacterium]|nr:hypothetical protein [Phycisphaerales bacterium]
MTSTSKAGEAQIDPTADVHPSAVIEGDVRVGVNCRIGAGAYLDGRLRPVRIGANTIIGAQCVIEATTSAEVNIGEWVTIQPGAIVQGARVSGWADVGARCVLAEGSHVECWGSVADGSVLPAGKIVPERYRGSGNPIRMVGEHATAQVQAAARERKRASVANSALCNRLKCG